MTDEKFLATIKDCIKAFGVYKGILEIAEKEYERRYKDHPSDVDNDYWIDAMHYGQGDIPSIAELMKSVKIAHRPR